NENALTETGRLVHSRPNSKRGQYRRLHSNRDQGPKISKSKYFFAIVWYVPSLRNSAIALFNASRKSGSDFRTPIAAALPNIFGSSTSGPQNSKPFPSSVFKKPKFACTSSWRLASRRPDLRSA